MFQHKEDVKRSLSVAWKNKILWIWGLFLAESYVFTGVKMTEDRRALIKKVFTMEFWSNFASSTENVFGFLVKQYWIFGLLVIVLSVFAVLSRGSMLISLAEMKKGKDVKFMAGLKAGAKKFWKLLGVMVLFWLGNLPIFVIWYVGIGAAIPVIVGIGAALFFIYNLMVILFKHYAYCQVVYENVGVGTAIVEGWKLFAKKWKDTLIGQGFRAVITAAMSLGMILAAIVITITFFVLSLIAAAFLGGIGFNIVAMVGLAAIFVAMLVCNAYLNTFVYCYLTRLYWALREG
jgi:hypothetical protein